MFHNNKNFISQLSCVLHSAGPQANQPARPPPSRQPLSRTFSQPPASHSSEHSASQLSGLSSEHSASPLSGHSAVPLASRQPVLQLSGHSVVHFAGRQPVLQLSVHSDVRLSSQFSNSPATQTATLSTASQPCALSHPETDRAGPQPQNQRQLD